MDFFEGTYYINLDERLDRKEQFERQASELGIIATRFPGIRISEEDLPDRWKKYYEQAPDKNTESWRRSMQSSMGEIGCAYSHKEIIKNAQQIGLKNVLVFEDDCVFLDTWKNNIQSVVDEIISFNNDWDMIYFGGELPGPLQVPEDYATKQLTPSTGGIYCLHAYAVNQRYFHKILSYDPEYCRQIDVMLVNSSGKNYVPKSSMVIQKSNTFSNITNNMTSEHNEAEQIERWNTNIKK